MFNALATTIKHKRIDEYEGSGAAVSGAPSADGTSTAGEGSRPINLSSQSDETPRGSVANCCMRNLKEMDSTFPRKHLRLPCSVTIYAAFLCCFMLDV